MRCVCALAVTLVAISAAPLRAATAPEGAAQFRAAVAPIFTQHCLACHNDQQSKGGLSLASARAAAAGGESGPVLVPGKPEESLLVGHIAGPEPEMPKGGPALSAEQVAAVRQWVAAGAEWPAELVLAAPDTSAWWSLAPLARPAVPALDSEWIRTPIDAFVLAKLNELQLHPAEPADRRTLIRRLTFDLHGLPPTAEEVAAFLADQRPEAYELLVDRLLASPRYGERWGRYWLDIVHYGESHGYDKDKPRNNSWPYRDYVIRALNTDKPYSRFVMEQLAGDVLYPDDPAATIATGFVAAGPWDFVGHVELREGTVDKLIARSNDRDDMVMSTVSTFLSMTVHCARCHDHKFDPITQQDYYRLQAVFAGVDRADRPYRDAESFQQRTALEKEGLAAAAELEALEKRRAGLTSPELARLDERCAALAGQLAGLADPFTGAPTTTTSGTGAASPTNGYHSQIAAAPETTKWVQIDLGEPRAIDVIRLIPARPTDFADTPGFGFPARFRVSLSLEPTFAEEHIVADQRAADFANPGNQPYTIFLDQPQARYVRVTADQLWPRTKDYVFALAELQVESAGRNVAAGAAVSALDSIEAGRWGAKYLVDGFNSRVALPDLAAPATAEALRARNSIERELAGAHAERARVAAALVPADLQEQLAASAARIAEIDRQLADLPAEKQVYALKSIPPRPIPLLRRGDVKSPAEPMSPGALACVPGLASVFSLDNPDDEGARRAALARWIVDPANVLARRSIVNRVWQYHFGAGLVETPNDFGRMGATPSHPQLLDWLAVEFFEQGESVKKLHKLIVTSSVYRQASQGDPAGARIDSANRYLWRQNRRRLDAEAVRDAALAVSGKLDTTMGGPAVRQFAFKDDHSPIYDYARFDVDNPAAYRRSVYRFIVRSVPDPLMECLDCADPSLLTPKRNTTLTALQALALLNNALFVRQAEHLALRVAALADSPRAQVEVAYHLALQRSPSDEELQLLVDFTTQHGLAGACRLLLNSNEFVFVD